MARGAGLKAVIEATRLPFHPGVEALAEAGVRTGASGRNFASYGAEAALPADYPQHRLDLLTDPQTSGGLLIACAPEAADQVLARARALGFASAAVIGHMAEGAGAEVVG
jgi:selenide,water dikinase